MLAVMLKGNGRLKLITIVVPRKHRLLTLVIDFISLDSVGIVLLRVIPLHSLLDVLSWIFLVDLFKLHPVIVKAFESLQLGEDAPFVNDENLVWRNGL